jgi:putative transport protein
LYVLKMDPIVLTGAVAGARNSTTAMRAISDRTHSSIPAFGYPVPYALSTVVFLIYGYLMMVLG